MFKEDDENAMQDRLIGEYLGEKNGNLLIALAGIHGNETSGLAALKNVYKHLGMNHPRFNGAFVSLSGNLPAMAENKRFIDVDFNRIWLPEVIGRVSAASNGQLSVEEEKQLKVLLETIARAIESSGAGTVTILDLHNTSSATGYFAYVPNTRTGKQITSAMHIPVIMGVNQEVNGTAIEYFHRKGYMALAFEGGKIGEASSIQIHEAGIWLLLAGLGFISKKDVPGYDRFRQLLSDATTGFPRFTELAYAHKITPEDGFSMLQNFENFQLIEKGQEVAQDRNGPVRAPVSGYMLMPLYQQQGGEGFFIVREVEK